MSGDKIYPVPAGQSEFELSIYVGCLERLALETETLKEQFRQAAVKERRMTGIGLFVDYAVPDSAPKLPTEINATDIGFYAEVSTFDESQTGRAVHGRWSVGGSGKLLGAEILRYDGRWPTEEIGRAEVEEASVHPHDHLKKF